jgi:hypothetical protein
MRGSKAINKLNFYLALSQLNCLKYLEMLFQRSMIVQISDPSNTL